MTIDSLARGDGCLPDWHELWAAARGNGDFGRHPITAGAYELARSHRLQQPRRRTQTSRRRGVLIQAIDAWADEYLRPADRQVSIGSYIDKLAAAAVAADEALRCDQHEGTTGEGLHKVFTEAARWAAGWTEIVDTAAPRTYRVGP
ncbi:hypothetical protein C5E45_20455 [Nocardia nova]|uniref:DUF4254 domain-containing protein n=1 Tax=Nocardia nova TaxID=37330 RepID=A0A2S6AMF2_9NOCA|nr:hypothetical protein C5E45_20455 [Nocardia nova]